MQRSLKKKPNLGLFHLTTWVWTLLLIFALGSCARQNAGSGNQYASTRSNQPKQSKKQRKADFDPNTQKKFEPMSKREMKKKARMMKKPQYTDPLYFGHKKKPKKRPPGKRKYCKECGMIH